MCHRSSWHPGLQGCVAQCIGSLQWRNVRGPAWHVQHEQGLAMSCDALVPPTQSCRSHVSHLAWGAPTMLVLVQAEAACLAHAIAMLQRAVAAGGLTCTRLWPRWFLGDSESGLGDLCPWLGMALGGDVPPGPRAPPEAVVRQNEVCPMLPAGTQARSGIWALKPAGPSADDLSVRETSWGVADTMCGSCSKRWLGVGK